MFVPANIPSFQSSLYSYVGAPVIQWVKGWSADLAAPGSSTAWGGELFTRKWGFIAHSLSLSPTHDMTEILL